MTNPKRKSLRIACSFLLMLLLALPAFAQEAEGEEVPGMRMRRDPSGLPKGFDLFNAPPQQKYVPSVPERAPAETKAPEPTEAPPAPEEAAPATVEAPVPPLSQPIYMDNSRKLRFAILNKQTTRLSEQEVLEGGSVNHGPLSVTLIECWHSAPDMKEESAALLEISEKKPDLLPEVVYRGWMFGSNPSLNPLEHPVYDIILRECK